jgi:hypothetical protein
MPTPKKTPTGPASDIVKIDVRLDMLVRDVAKLDSVLQQHIATMQARDDSIIRGVERVRGDLERFDQQRMLEVLQRAHTTHQEKLFELISKHLAAQEETKKRKDERLAIVAKAVWEKGGSALILGLVLLFLGILQQLTGIQTIPGLGLKP